MMEASLVRKVKKAIHERWPGAYVRKLADTYTRGLPDLLIIIAGRTVFAELKTLAGRLKPIQNEEHRKIERAGGFVVVARSVEEMITAIEEALCEH